MEKNYRVSLAESTYDGESWSVNQYYSQPYIVSITESSDSKSIVKALKNGGLLKKTVKYTGWTIDGDADYGLYLERYYTNNQEPIIIELLPIDDKDLQRELNSHYGITHIKTQMCKA